VGHAGGVVAEVFGVKDDVPAVQAVAAPVGNNVARLERVVVGAKPDSLTRSFNQESVLTR